MKRASAIWGGAHREPDASNGARCGAGGCSGAWAGCGRAPQMWHTTDTLSRRASPSTTNLQPKKTSAQAAVHGCGTMVWPRCYCRGCRMRGKGESSVRRPAECGCPRGRTAAAVPPRPPRPRARGNHCVCAPHSPAHFAGCAACGAEAGSGARERREPARDATWAAVGHRMCSAVCVRSPGWTGARLGAKEMRVVAAQPQVCGRGVTSGRKSSNWSSRAKPTIPSRGTPAQRRARSGFEDRRPPQAAAQDPRHDTRRREPATLPTKKKGVRRAH